MTKNGVMAKCLLISAPPLGAQSWRLPCLIHEMHAKSPFFLYCRSNSTKMLAEKPRFSPNEFYAKQIRRLYENGTTRLVGCIWIPKLIKRFESFEARFIIIDEYIIDGRKKTHSIWIAEYIGLRRVQLNEIVIVVHQFNVLRTKYIYIYMYID